MKYLKFLAVALCAVGFTSCGDFDFTPDAPKINTLSGVTVSMENADMSFFENKGIVKVPFKVEGERNGDITVTCVVSEVPEAPAIAPFNYIFTTETVIVNKEDNTGAFEIRLINDNVINDNRMFDIKLASGQGCSISGIDQTIVTIKDDDSDPYVRLGGDWLLTLNNGTTKGGIRLEAQEEGTEGYYKYYIVTGFFTDENEKDVEMIAKFDYDMTTQEGKIVIEYGQDLPSYTSGSNTFTGILGYLYEADGGLYGSIDGEAAFTWDEGGNQLQLLSWPVQDEVAEWGCDFTYLLLLNGKLNSYLDRISGVTGMVRADG